MPKFSPKEKDAGKSGKKKIKTFSLVLTTICPIKCVYCFEKHKTSGTGFMDFEVAKEAISDTLDCEDEFDYVLLDLFGGEPLEAYSLIVKIVEWCTSRSWEKKYHFTIGTNGVLLNDEMKNWFSQNRELVTVGLSLDGNRTAHNISRNGTYDLIFPHIEFFKENWPEQPSKMTICAETIPYIADSIIEMEKMNLYFSANLVFENIWGTPRNKKRLLKIYKEQLERLVDFYIEHDDLYPAYPILGLLPYYLGIPGYGKVQENGCVRFCGAGHEMTVVDIDGTRYPCHRFLPWITGKESPKDPANCQTSWKPEKCATCKIIQSCPTCAGFNWEENGDTGIRTTYHCEAHKLEAAASAKIVAERLKKMPTSYLDSMKAEECTALFERVNSLIDLIDNGI